MLRPFRLLLLAALAAAVYFGFFEIPASTRDAAAFDPAVVAAQETAAWRAAASHDEFAVFPSLALMLREQYRYTWFRAARSAYALSRASTQFVSMRNRYDRVLPDLEEVASVEQSWTGVEFDPAEAANVQLKWWVANKMPMFNSTDDISSLMAEEYSIRYGQRAGDFLAATRFRAEAVRLRDATVDPDWDTVETLLLESYRALQAALARGRAVRAGV